MNKTLICFMMLGVMTVSVNAFTKNTWKRMLPTALSEQELIIKKDDVVIRGITPNSPAAKSGLHVDDQIILINEKPVESLKNVLDVLNDTNNKITLLLKRGTTSIKKDVILNPQPPRLGVNFIDKKEVSISKDNEKELTGCKIIFSGTVVATEVLESPEYYQVGVFIKNLGKKPTLAPYKISLQDSNSAMLKLMMPQELLYATYGSDNGAYAPPPHPITSLPTSYSVSSSSTMTGNTLNTESIVTAKNSSQQAMNGLYNLSAAIGTRRAAKTAANRQKDEVWLNNNYLRKSEIPADALSQGVLFFAKSLNDTHGVKAIIYVDENTSGICNFISESDKRKK